MSLLLTAIGLTIPADSMAQSNVNKKSINYNAPVKCCKTISIHATPQRVWQVLTDINKWSVWQADISHSSVQGEIKANTTFKWKTGGTNITSTIHTAKTNHLLGWTGKTMGLLAIHNWTLDYKDGNTTITVDESMDGILAILFKKSFNKSLEKGMLHWLELLKKECEKQ
jgi:uncharacterized protein YndB with AHSA1/START domain